MPTTKRDQDSKTRQTKVRGEETTNEKKKKTHGKTIQSMTRRHMTKAVKGRKDKRRGRQSGQDYLQEARSRPRPGFKTNQWSSMTIIFKSIKYKTRQDMAKKNKLNPSPNPNLYQSLP
jgi:hypothetical protein